MSAHVIHVSEMDDHPGAVYIGRAVPRKGLKASKWGNPFASAIHGRGEAVRLYDQALKDGYLRRLLADLPELRDRPLACWCRHASQRVVPETLCHGDILAKLLALYTDDELRAMAQGPARPMTQPQIKFIRNVQRRLHLSGRALDVHCERRFGCAFATLTTPQASALLDELQGWIAVPADLQRACGQLDMFGVEQ